MNEPLKLDPRIEQLIAARPEELRAEVRRHYPQPNLAEELNTDFVGFVLRRQTYVLEALERVGMIPPGPVDELFPNTPAVTAGEVERALAVVPVPAVSPPVATPLTFPIDAEIFSFYAGMGEVATESMLAPCPLPERPELYNPPDRDPLGFYVHPGNAAARRPMTLSRIWELLQARFGLEAMILPEFVRSSREPVSGPYSLTMAFDRAPFVLPTPYPTTNFPEEALYALFWGWQRCVIWEPWELVVFPETTYVVPEDKGLTRLLGRKAKERIAPQAPSGVDNPRVLCARMDGDHLLVEAVRLYSVASHAEELGLRPVVRAVLRG